MLPAHSRDAFFASQSRITRIFNFRHSPIHFIPATLVERRIPPPVAVWCRAHQQLNKTDAQINDLWLVFDTHDAAKTALYTLEDSPLLTIQPALPTDLEPFSSLRRINLVFPERASIASARDINLIGSPNMPQRKKAPLGLTILTSFDGDKVHNNRPHVPLPSSSSSFAGALNINPTLPPTPASFSPINPVHPHFSNGMRRTVTNPIPSNAPVLRPNHSAFLPPPPSSASYQLSNPHGLGLDVGARGSFEENKNRQANLLAYVNVQNERERLLRAQGHNVGLVQAPVHSIVPANVQSIQGAGSGNVQFRPGDWICGVSTCNTHNFGRNHACIACGTVPGAGAGGVGVGVGPAGLIGGHGSRASQGDYMRNDRSTGFGGNAIGPSNVGYSSMGINPPFSPNSLISPPFFRSSTAFGNANVNALQQRQNHASLPLSPLSPISPFSHTPFPSQSAPVPSQPQPQPQPQAQSNTQSILTPDGKALAQGGWRVVDVSHTPSVQVMVSWPWNAALPKPGQVRPHPEFGAHPPILNTGNTGPIQTQAGDWHCSVCGYTNWRRRRVCQSCFPFADGNMDGPNGSAQMEKISTIASMLLAAANAPSGAGSGLEQDPFEVVHERSTVASIVPRHPLLSNSPLPLPQRPEQPAPVHHQITERRLPLLMRNASFEEITRLFPSPPSPNSSSSPNSNSPRTPAPWHQPPSSFNHPLIIRRSEEEESKFDFDMVSLKEREREPLSPTDPPPYTPVSRSFEANHTMMPQSLFDSPGSRSSGSGSAEYMSCYGDGDDGDGDDDNDNDGQIEVEAEAEADLMDDMENMFLRLRSRDVFASFHTSKTSSSSSPSSLLSSVESSSFGSPLGLCSGLSSSSGSGLGLETCAPKSVPSSVTPPHSASSSSLSLPLLLPPVSSSSSSPHLLTGHCSIWTIAPDEGKTTTRRGQRGQGTLALVDAWNSSSSLV